MLRKAKWSFCCPDIEDHSLGEAKEEDFCLAQETLEEGRKVGNQFCLINEGYRMERRKGNKERKWNERKENEIRKEDCIVFYNDLSLKSYSCLTLALFSLGMRSQHLLRLVSVPQHTLYFFFTKFKISTALGSIQLKVLGDLFRSFPNIKN